MNEFYKVADNKKIRVIIDTDAACEADDQYAIAHALMTQKFIVRGITAEHFHADGSEQKSYDEIRKLLKIMNSDDISVYHGKPLSSVCTLSGSGYKRCLCNSEKS